MVVDLTFKEISYLVVGLGDNLVGFLWYIACPEKNYTGRKISIFITKRAFIQLLFLQKHTYIIK